jgi:multiple sugar transport system substrate-binding protein
MKKGYLFILLTILIIGCGSKEMRKANDYMDKSEYEKAITLLTLEVQDNPKNAEAHFLLGKCYLLADNQGEGCNEYENCFKKAILLDSSYNKSIGNFFFNKSLDLYKEGWGLAEVYYDEALKYYPDGKDSFVDQLFNYTTDLTTTSSNNEKISELFEIVIELSDKYANEISNHPSSLSTPTLFAYSFINELKRKNFKYLSRFLLSDEDINFALNEHPEFRNLNDDEKENVYNETKEEVQLGNEKFLKAVIKDSGFEFKSLTYISCNYDYERKSRHNPYDMCEDYNICFSSESGTFYIYFEGIMKLNDTWKIMGDNSELKNQHHDTLISKDEVSDERNSIIELTFWHAMSGPLGNALSEMVQLFNDTYSNIRVTLINVGNYTALSQKLMSSIQNGNQPDVAQVYSAWTPNLLHSNDIVPIEDFMKNDPDFSKENLDDFYPVFIQSNTFDGKLVTIPFNKSVRVLYYNKDIFLKNGIDQNMPPKTWTSFLEYCQKFSRNSNNNEVSKIYGTTLKLSTWQFENLVLQANGEIFSDTKKKVLFNSPEGVIAINFLKQLLKKDNTAYISQGYKGMNDFLDGKVAMYEDSSVSFVYMKEEGFDFNIGITSIPFNKTKRNIVSGTDLAIFNNNNERTQKAAWEFIKWFSNTKQTARWSELTYYLPIRKSAVNFEGLKKRVSNNPEILSVYDQLYYATFEPRINE